MAPYFVQRFEGYTMFSSLSKGRVELGVSVLSVCRTCTKNMSGALCIILDLLSTVVG